MVDKIELQLSDVQVKIGDKLHYLDKDMDGILSRVEMADVLSQVLKDLSFEEALEIADEMVSLYVLLHLPTAGRIHINKTPNIIPIMSNMSFISPHSGRKQRRRFYCSRTHQMDRNKPIGKI